MPALAAANHTEENEIKDEDKNSKSRQSKFLTLRMIDTLNKETEHKDRTTMTCSLEFESFVVSAKLDCLFQLESVQVLNNEQNKFCKSATKNTKNIENNTVEKDNDTDNDIDEIASMRDDMEKNWSV